MHTRPKVIPDNDLRSSRRWHCAYTTRSVKEDPMTRPREDQRESDFPFIGKVAARELVLAGYTRLEQLTQVSKKDLLRLHGVGPKALSILKQALAEKGLALKEE
jgi:hypothetical protein